VTILRLSDTNIVIEIGSFSIFYRSLRLVDMDNQMWKLPAIKLQEERDLLHGEMEFDNKPVIVKISKQV
jgi:hypothetical protein